MAAKKKARRKKADATVGTWGHHVNQQLEYVREHAPTLVPLVASFLPFWDVVAGVSAGPQPQCKVHGDMDQPQWVTLEIMDPHRGLIHPDGAYSSVYIRITAACITLEEAMTLQDDKDSCFFDESLMTLQQAWSYLRQIPRPASSFGVPIDEC